MAYTRRSTGRNRRSTGRVHRTTRSAGSGRYRKSAVSRKRVGSKRGHARGASRRVLQTLRIELAPGLSLGKSGGAIGRPIPTRRTRHF